jgi:biotin operon repressor
MQRRIAQIDQNTGELLEGVVALVSSRKRNGFGKEWFAMAMSAAMDFARADLSAADYRVLLAMLAKLDFENHLAINQADLARELDLHRVTVCRSISTLLKLGIILETGKSPNGYRLNPSMAWRGSGRNHREALSHLRLTT